MTTEDQIGDSDTASPQWFYFAVSISGILALAFTVYLELYLLAAVFGIATGIFITWGGSDA